MHLLKKEGNKSRWVHFFTYKWNGLKHHLHAQAWNVFANSRQSGVAEATYNAINLLILRIHRRRCVPSSIQEQGKRDNSLSLFC